ncbi:MAG: hypothetical protein ACRD9Q_08785 [Nitrososphaeraceae archaeon]
MVKRISVMIDEDLDKKLRLRQAKLIQTSNQSISFSQVLNSAVRSGLEHTKLCNCTYQCPAHPRDRLVHVDGRCYHNDDTSHKIYSKR